MNIPRIYNDHKEIILYLFFGVLTTVCNWLVFFLSNTVFNINVVLANTIAWFCSVLFAYFTNRHYVFSIANTGKAVVKEIFDFFVSRLSTGIIETLLLWFFVDYKDNNPNLTKIFVSIIVVVLNYIFSKFIVFRKKRR